METYFDNIKQKLLVESAIPDLFMIINEEEKPSVLGTAGKAAGIGAGLAGLGAMGKVAYDATEALAQPGLTDEAKAALMDVGKLSSQAWTTFLKWINPTTWGNWISNHFDTKQMTPETQKFLQNATSFLTNPTTIGLGAAGAVIAGLYLIKKKQYDKKKELDFQTLARARALSQLPPQQAQKILQQIQR